MRIQEMYFLCKSALKQWEPAKFQELKSGGSVIGYSFENLMRVNSALSVVEPIKPFKDKIEILRNMNAGLFYGSTRATLEPSCKNQYLSLLEQIHQDLETVCNICEDAGYDDTQENGFDIKLPDNISLIELSKITDQLNAIFSQCPILKYDDALIQFKSVEKGSCWLSFAIIGGAALMLLNALANFVDKVLIIRSHEISCRQQEAQLRNAHASGEFITQTLDMHQKMKQLLLDDLEKRLADENGIHEPEDIERLNYSVKCLNDLMEKGIEFHATINAAEEVKAVFPPIEQQRLDSSVLKLLEWKTTQES